MEQNAFTLPIPCAKGSFFISFEGGEGSGKSTQVALLADFLRQCGLFAEVVTCREPGGTLLGESLRSLLLHPQEPIEPLSQLLLFASARAQLLNTKILPALQRERVVVLVDRFIDSSIAYQGVGLNVGIQAVLDVHRCVPLCYRPHLSFLLDIDAECSRQRVRERDNQIDYYEKQQGTFQNKVLEGLRLAAQLSAERFVVVDGKNTKEQIQKDIQEHFLKRFKIMKKYE